MANSSTNATINRCANLRAAAQPLAAFRARKKSMRSDACETNHPVKAPVEVPGKEVFEEMFVVSRQQFVAMAYSILRNREDAEDAVQNAFISGYLHLRNFQGRSAVKTWFTRVVLNAALMIRRKQRSVQLEDSKWMDGIPSSEPDPELRWAKTEALGLIEEVTAHLEPRRREAFLMYYGKDKSVIQACAVAGVSVSTFKARLFRARRQVISEAKRALVLRRPQTRVSSGCSLSDVS